MNTKEIKAWRTIVAILRETGYDKLYDEEVHIVVECLRRCKKQKEVIDKTKNHINDKFVTQGGFTSYEWNDLLKQLLDILKEVSE